MVNAVMNATRHATEITLTTAARAGSAAVHVRDNGPGFTDSMLDHAFDRFAQGDRRGAAGLGLAIVRRIAQLHGGNATVRNRDGGGAEVTIEIPLKA
jgi:signal transduction histidine kinase